MFREDLRDQTEETFQDQIDFGTAGSPIVSASGLIGPETFGLGGVTQAVVARQKGEPPGFFLANGQSRRQLEGIRSAEWMRP